jgi:hypothetical protein
MELKPNVTKTVTLQLTEREIAALRWFDEILPDSSWTTVDQYGLRHTGAITHYDSEVEGMKDIITQAFAQIGEKTRRQKSAEHVSHLHLTGWMR